jgi:hypothetical protein
MADPQMPGTQMFDPPMPGIQMSGTQTSGARQGLGTSRPESLVDVLDSLLDTGVVADAQVVISVAGVDLIFVGLRALLASMDTASRMMLAPPSAGTPLAGGPV